MPTNIQNEILRIFRHGDAVAVFILGRRNTGKTNHSLYIAETVAEAGLIVRYASNILIYKAPFEIEHIVDMETLEEWCKAYSGRKLFILDEAGKALRRRTPMAKLNIEIIDKLQILRKYKLSLVMIAPDEKYVDNAGLGSDVLDAVIVKPEFKNPKIALYRDIMEDREAWFRNIPASSIEYDTWDIAPFKLKAEIAKTAFSDPELNLLQRYADGATIQSLGIHKETFRRLLRKFAKRYTEQVRTQTPKIALEVSSPLEQSQKRL